MSNQPNVTADHNIAQELVYWTQNAQGVFAANPLWFRTPGFYGPAGLLVLLCHKFALWQQGHRGSRRAILRANLMRMLVMDDLTWRSVRIGGSAASKTVG